MKFILVLLFCIAAVACFEDPQEFHLGSADQSVNPPNWDGTWTALNKYGGVMYTCTKGDRLYGVYSNAGFFIGTIVDRTVEGNWFEGGRGDRNAFQGTFHIKISDDNQEFDGYWNRVQNGGFKGTEVRWHETRLGHPHPQVPSAEECLMPDDTVNAFVGSWYRSVETGALPGTYDICRDEWDQVYGSFYQPDGYITGWSVFNSEGFHGYRYDSTGESGAYIMKSLSQNKMKGFYWKGRIAYQNEATSQPEVLFRRSFTTTLAKCENVGPGFTERLKGPNFSKFNDSVNNAATFATSLFVVLGAVFVALF